MNFFVNFGETLIRINKLSMKTIIVLIIGLAFLGSCTTESTDYEKEFTNKVEQFKSTDNDKLQAFIAELDGIKIKLDCRKPQKNIEGISLNFDNGSVFQMNFNYWNDTTKLGAYNKHFADQKHLVSLNKVIAKPDSTFIPHLGFQGKCSEFDKLKIKVLKKIDNREYVVYLYDIKTKPPKWYGDTYEQGTYEGKILLYDIKKSELLSIIEFNAMSSTYVSAENFGSLGEAAEADFDKNIKEAFILALKENFNVTGNPSFL